jgi:hypothetical protein
VLRQFLDESSHPRGIVAALEEETLFNSDSSDSDDEWDGDGQFDVPGAKIKRHPM